MKALKFSYPLVMLTVLFVTCLIVANIIAGKLWSTPFFGIVLTCGVFCFPLVYIIDDVIPEVYGYAIARRVIFLGFAANLLAVAFFLLTISVKFPAYFGNQDAFTAVLGFTPRLLAASFIGYLAGTNVNAWTLTAIKRLTGPRFLWIRTIGSTLDGELIDSTLFILIAFYGVLPTSALPGMVLAQAAFKTLYEALVTPITYLVINSFKKLEKVDQYAEPPSSSFTSLEPASTPGVDRALYPGD